MWCVLQDPSNRQFVLSDPALLGLTGEERFQAFSHNKLFKVRQEEGEPQPNAPPGTRPMYAALSVKQSDATAALITPPPTSPLTRNCRITSWAMHEGYA